MNEWIIIAVVTMTTACFATGGTGYKWVRRYLMPILLGVAMFFLGAIWWKILIAMPCLMGLMTLGYGDSVPEPDKWILRALIFMGYFLPVILFSWQLGLIFSIVGGLTLTFVMYQSQKGWVTWKLWELLAGFLIGFTYIGGIV